MTDPIEIMARAIVDARGEHPEGSQHRFCDGEMHSATFLQIADHNARAVIAALADAGYAVVPLEPTEAMERRGMFEAESCTDDWTVSAACLPRHVYRAMIKAGMVAG